MGIRIGIGLRIGGRKGEIPYVIVNAETQAYVDYATSEDETLTSDEIQKLDIFITTIKTGLGHTALSDGFDTLYWWRATTPKTSLRNLAKDLHHATNSNAVHTPGMGWKGNGTNQYINLNYNPGTQGSKFTRNSASIGVYIADNVESATQSDTGSDISGTNRIYINTGATVNAVYGGINSDFMAVAITGASSVGLTIFSRTAADNIYCYKNGVYETKNLASSPVSDAAAYALRAATTYSTRTQGLLWYGRGFSLEEMAVITNAFFFSLGQDVEIDVNNFGATGDGETDDFAAIQALINKTGPGSTIRIGHDREDVYFLSQPLIFKSDIDYIIDGTIKIQDGDTVLLTADTSIGENTLTIAIEDVSKFAVGQWVSATDDMVTFESAGTEYVRELQYGWGGVITDITGNVITLEGTCNYNLDVSENAKMGHSQGCIIIQNAENITVSGSGLINGNRYNQIPVLPSTSLSLHGHWEHQRCAMSFVIWNSHYITLDGLTIEDGRVHSLSISSVNLGGNKTWNSNILLKNLKVNTGHDKNILVRFTEYMTVKDCESTGNYETWEDGLIFYSDCEHCEVDGFIARTNKRSGICTNNVVNNISVKNIHTLGNSTRTGNGVSLMGQFITAEDILVEDTFAIGGAYTTTDLVATNIIVESNQLPRTTYLRHDRIVGITGQRITLNNFIMRNSISKTGYDAIVIASTVEDVEFNEGGVYNHTGQIISQASYNKATWNDFEGIIITP